ncbi:hypothetical protein PM082_007547 [Marasmius tenuissimus]|nr:hypothetical protein PM082_007547 [Marasmius tenuissimus]
MVLVAAVGPYHDVQTAHKDGELDCSDLTPMAAEMWEEGKRFSGGTANFLGRHTKGFGGRTSVDDDAGKDQGH